MAPKGQTEDDAFLEAIVDLFEPAERCSDAGSTGSSSEADYELLLEESIQVLTDNDGGSVLSTTPTTVKIEPDVDDEVLAALAALYVGEEVANVTELELSTGDATIKAEWTETYSQALATFKSPHRMQFISVEPPLLWRVSQLQCSARIFHDDMEVVLNNFGCILLIDDTFVAKVKLMNVGPVLQAVDFYQASKALFRQLCVTEIYVDKVMAKRDRCRAELLSTINRIRERSNTDNVCAFDALQLFTVVQTLDSLSYVDLCLGLYCSTTISQGLRDQAAALLEVEEVTERRNAFLAKLHATFPNSTRELNEALREFRGGIVASRVKSLLDMAPPYLQNVLKGVPQRTIFQIHDADVKVFHDMDKVLNKDVFGKPLEDLAKRWASHVKSMKQGERIVSVMNPVYFSLSRSLEELVQEIAERTEHKPEELLLNDGSGWHPLKSAIKWKSETGLNRCLEQEYRFIFRLLKHFDPVVGNSKAFDYQVQRLLPGENSTLNVFLRPFRRLIGRNQENPLGVADELYVWFCLLDDVLHHTLPETEHGLDTFEQILKDFVQLIRKASVEQMETIRVITHNTARFIVQTHPFVDQAQSGEDKQILQAQLAVINRLMLGAESTNTFRDLIDVFSSYWKNRCEIIERIPAKNAFEEMGQIKKALLKIVVVALGKNASAGHMVELFRSLNDFLVDLDDVSFDWLIKSVPGLAMASMADLKLAEPVQNKWTNTANQTFRVTDPNKFQKLISLLLDGATSPKHYVIDVVITLLNYIHAQLQRTNWTDLDQIASCSVLISSIRSSLIYLREQPDYVSFELFREESTKPFGNVVENSASLEDFVKRIGLIKESFCYIRKQNEMSVAEALRLFAGLNGKGNFSTDRLQRSYQQYSDQFEAYMAEPATDKAATIAKVLRQSVKPALFKDWTVTFKQEQLPKLLAGVAAVWSVMVSEDVSSTGKFFKPHCVQVLCVLRLLGVDGDGQGVSKHLAQVLTGQGKSLVLAMIASVLALTGHDIQVVCYNEYLVKRDAKDFADFYTKLSVKDAVRYATFKEMAQAIIKPEVGGKTKGLRSFVEDLIISGPSVSCCNKPKAKVQDKSVLLMDEVDVFFTKEYYGSSYIPATMPYVQGLREIQETIWHLVKNRGEHDVQHVTDTIQTFISSSRFRDKYWFTVFLNKRASYDLLIDRDNKYVRQTYTNKSLFYEHLNTMIVNAISVATVPSHYADYKINADGNIVQRIGEKYEQWTITQYLSVFNYFRLKKDKPNRSTDYNYGYLTLDCGSLSYAMLPKTFPLILGVTGTLSSLNQYEKSTIESLYNITHSSIMPSFFGCSNLQFNPVNNFNHLSTRPLWMSKIFTQAYAAVSAKRAVVIFFFNGQLLEEFRAQYCGQFDRLQVLTENTPDGKQDHLIGEAGITKTVTLATRGMGRGVDYKSSVAVEKHGGVHVIQTFFSLDVKEETQIRGRTARKDNRGSYEQILYDAHLKTQRLIEESGRVSYAGLDAARTRLSLKENKDIEEAIRANENDHATTLAYLQSFFN